MSTLEPKFHLALNVCHPGYREQQESISLIILSLCSCILPRVTQMMEYSGLVQPVSNTMQHPIQKRNGRLSDSCLFAI